VGEGPLQADLEARARALDLADRFRFAGFARDVAQVLSAFDLSVFPSLWEGTPLTVFEALAMGKPIVATEADGLRDVLIADETARLVPVGDAAALADAILWMMAHPTERARFAATARVAGQSYGIDAFVRKMERLYTLLHEVSRATKRQGILSQDLSFLAGARS
jgi:glycosyltransferase involved in cell wall biosynthesis